MNVCNTFMCFIIFPGHLVYTFEITEEEDHEKKNVKVLFWKLVVMYKDRLHILFFPGRVRVLYSYTLLS